MSLKEYVSAVTIEYLKKYVLICFAAKFLIEIGFLIVLFFPTLFSPYSYTSHDPWTIKNIIIDIFYPLLLTTLFIPAIDVPALIHISLKTLGTLTIKNFIWSVLYAFFGGFLVALVTFGFAIFLVSLTYLY